MLSDLLAGLPRDDVVALEKYWGGRLPEARGLGEKPALLVVDMTRGFVENRFPMGWAATGEPCATAIAVLLEAARRAGIPVFFTRGAPYRLEAEVGVRLRDRSLGDFEQGIAEEEHEIVPALAPRPDEVVITKAKPSAFFGSQLEAMLTYRHVDTVMVAGMVTTGCVRATVVDAFSLNYRVLVPVDCVADRSDLSHRVELVTMGVKYADLTTSADLIAELDGRH